MDTRKLLLDPYNFFFGIPKKEEEKKHLQEEKCCTAKIISKKMLDPPNNKNVLTPRKNKLCTTIKEVKIPPYIFVRLPRPP